MPRAILAGATPCGNETKAQQSEPSVASLVAFGPGSAAHAARIGIFAVDQPTHTANDVAAVGDRTTGDAFVVACVVYTRVGRARIAIVAVRCALAAAWDFGGLADAVVTAVGCAGVAVVAVLGCFAATFNVGSDTSTLVATVGCARVAVVTVACGLAALCDGCASTDVALAAVFGAVVTIVTFGVDVAAVCDVGAAAHPGCHIAAIRGACVVVAAVCV